MTKRGRDQAKRSAPDAPETSTAQGMSFSGKYEERRYVSELPDPNDLAKLENLHPGTVELILEQYQEQARHRRDMERKVIEGNVRQQNRGPIYGMILVVGALGCGTYLIATGRDGGGLATIITALASPVAVFIGGRIMQYVERKGKN